MSKEARSPVQNFDEYIKRLAKTTATGQYYADILSETDFETGDSRKKPISRKRLRPSHVQKTPSSNRS